MKLIGAGVVGLGLSAVVALGALDIAPETPVSESFDTLGTNAIATLPAGWRVATNSAVRTVGAFALASNQTARRASTNLSSSASAGIYNYGVEDLSTERAVGWLSSSTGCKSGNLFLELVNSGAAAMEGLQIAYNVEKYRQGSNAAGFRIQLYTSTDGTNWTSAGTNFLTQFAADSVNTGYNPAPGTIIAVAGALDFSGSPVAPGAAIFLAWNYSVASGSTSSSAQALGVDDIAVSVPGSKITGTVTGPDGTTSVENITVEAYSVGLGDWITTATSGANGTYELKNLDSGSYRVMFSDSTGFYGPQVYSNYAGLSPAFVGTDIAIGESVTISNINAKLALASTISGRVTATDETAPLEGIEVTPYWIIGATTFSGPATYTDSAGDYTLRGLPAGTFRVAFTDPGGNYLPELFDNVAGAYGWEGGSNIVVGTAAMVSNINASLSLAAKIAGTVMAPDGTTPVTDCGVSVYYWTGAFWNSYDTTTDASGQYLIGGLRTGVYRVAFQPNNEAYAPELYDNVPGTDYADSGKDVLISTLGTVVQIDATLAPAGTVSGQVTGPDGLAPLPGIYVRVFRGHGAEWIWLRGADTQADGRYAVGGLAAGIYRVEFYDRNSIYAPETYNDFPGTDLGTEGTPIPVAEGAVVSNVDAALVPAARISGSVTGADGSSPLQNIWVNAYRWNGGAWRNAQYAETDAAGRYELAGLAVGVYRVIFEDGSGSFIREIYNDFIGGRLGDGGDDIPVPESGTVSNIDASLGAASWITGAVMESDGVTLLDDAGVEAYRWNGTGWSYYDSTYANGGTYEFGGLASGTYRLVFSSWDDSFVPEVYNDFAGTDFTHFGTDLLVAETSTVSGINAALAARPADADGDGMPDEWEQAHFSGATNANPEADTDGDNVEDGGEYIAGTDPRTNTSVLAVTAMNAPGAGRKLIFTWPSADGRVYSIWRGTNAAGVFTQHVGGIVATAPINIYTSGVPELQGADFYGLQVHWPGKP